MLLFRKLVTFSFMHHFELINAKNKQYFTIYNYTIRFVIRNCPGRSLYALISKKLSTDTFNTRFLFCFVLFFLKGIFNTDVIQVLPTSREKPRKIRKTRFVFSIQQLLVEPKPERLILGVKLNNNQTPARANKKKKKYHRFLHRCKPTAADKHSTKPQKHAWAKVQTSTGADPLTSQRENTLAQRKMRIQ